MKDLKLLVRDKAAAFFTFGFPLFIAILFGVIFGGGGGSGKMKIAVVNEDGGPASLAFADDLTMDAALDVVRGRGSDSRYTSIATDIIPFTRDEAIAQVRRGNVRAAVIVPKGFEEKTANMFGGGGLEVEAVVDPSAKAEAGLLTGKLNEIGFKTMARAFNDPGVMKTRMDAARASILKSEGLSATQKAMFTTMFGSIEAVSGMRGAGDGKKKDEAPASAASDGAAKDSKSSDESASGPGGWRPVKVSVSELAEEQNQPRNSYEVSFPQGIVWGLMGCVTAFGAGLASERSAGTLMRLMMAPLSRGSILFGKGLACFLACLMVQVMVLELGAIIFKIQIRQPMVMAVVVLVGSVGFTGVMMLIAGLSRTEGAAQGAGRAVLIVLALIGGGSIPLAFMPPFMQTLSGISPFKWETLAIEGALWRGLSLAEMALPLGVLAGVGIVGWVVGTACFKWGGAK